MKFENINQIREQFQLDGNTYKELRSQLKKLLSDKHPDKNKGEFNSEDEKDKFNEIQQALDFLEKSTLPVTQNEVTALIKAIAALSTTRNSTEISESLTNRIKHSISSFKKGHLFPKITTTAISIVLSALWLFPNTIKDHPVLSRLIDISSHNFMLLWLGSIILTGYLWLILKVVENRDLEIKKSLNLETTQNRIFNEFIRWEVIREKNVTRVSFTKDRLIEFIMDYDVRRERLRRNRSSLKRKLKGIFIFSFFPNVGEVDIEIAQNLSDLIIDRALSKSIIQKDNSKTLSDIYFLDYDEEEFEKYYRQHRL